MIKDSSSNINLLCIKEININKMKLMMRRLYNLEITIQFFFTISLNKYATLYI